MDRAQIFEGAFAEPVFAAQGAFRAVMDALARPGRIVPLVASTRPPLPLSPAAGALALTLCDHDTPVWLDPPLADAAGPAAWLGFHAGVPLVASPADAHFAFVATPLEFLALENFCQGSQDYPDRSATVVLQVEALEGGQPLRLAGPGVDGVARIAPAPLPRHFVEQWRQNRARFPRGVDVILAGHDAVVGLPRTVSIEPEG